MVLIQAWPILCKRPPQFADALHQYVIRNGESSATPPQKAHPLKQDDQNFRQGIAGREGLWPKRNLLAVSKETAALQVQDIVVKAAAI